MAIVEVARRRGRDPRWPASIRWYDEVGRVTSGMVAAPEAVASGEVRLGQYIDFFCIWFWFVSSVGH
ncbi:formin-like protein 6 [Iris pallida]|uniref:Formin-like protein 6 n=1 Tax=Iris pallida TaxID=29817 RepID=A0AAX6EVU5_IRIPA|nr:formin-like protein 6 [Iris pallida]